jgi:chitodextrinase
MSGVPLGFGLVAVLFAGAAPASRAVGSSHLDLADLAPGRPRNVSATALSSRRVQLTWDAVISVPAVKHYRIYRANGPIFTSTTTGFIDTTVQPNTSYSYRVSAVDSLNQEGPLSTPRADVTTPLPDNTPPTQPTGLTATSIGATHVDLQWVAASDPESGVASYNIYRDGAQVGSSTSTTFSDTGLQVNRTYVYEVSAVNGDGLEGARSFRIAVTTFDNTPPTAPTGLTAAAAGATQVDLSWTAASDPESGVASYNIYRDGAQVGSSTSTSFSDTGLSGNTTYTYQVSAVNGAGTEGALSTAVTVQTDDDTPPTAPSGLSAKAVAHDQVDLSWAAASDPESGVARYNIYRNGTVVGSSTSTSFSDTGLTGSTQYSYQVTAVNGDGLEGPPTATVVVTTPRPPDTTPPTVPTGLGATATSPTRVNLTWGASSDPESGVASYNIYRDGAQVGSSTSTSFTDTGVQGGTTYSYQVSAVNGEGLESGRSAAANVTTPAPADTTPPTVPTGLAASTPSPTSVDLTWNASSDPESGVATYNIYRDGTIAGSSTTTSFTDGSVQAGATYSYRVSAINGDGVESAQSSPLSVTTPSGGDASPPTVPGGLVVTPAGPTRVTLVWSTATDPESGVANYRIYRNGAFRATSTTTAFADTTVVANTQYTYQVSAVNGAGVEGGRSAPVTVTTPRVADTIPPAAPTRLRIVP